MIQQEALKINSTIPSKLALMYFEPESEGLEEISSDQVSFAVYPYESSVRRFYLCGDFIQDKLCTVSVDVDNPTAYSVKVLCGYENASIVDFNSAGKSHTTSLSIANFAYLNAIPIDILIESNTRTEYSVILELSISTEED